MEISKTKGCRCGSNTSKRTKVGASVYKSKIRCSCLSAGRKCAEGCRCHGKCGGDDCYDNQGKCKQPRSTPRKSRKRKQHEYQQHRRGTSSLKFAKLKGEEINEGPFNQLEYTLLCAITLIMEQTNQQPSSINAFKLFNDIVSKVDELNFNLPIYFKSQDEITKELNKIARIRQVPF